MGTSWEKINTAKNILWQISIKPTLEAYCGSMDEQSQVALVQKCEDAFKNKDAKMANKKYIKNTLPKIVAKYDLYTLQIITMILF